MELSTLEFGNTGRVDDCFHIITSQQVTGSPGASHKFGHEKNCVFGLQVTHTWHHKKVNGTPRDLDNRAPWSFCSHRHKLTRTHHTFVFWVMDSVSICVPSKHDWVPKLTTIKIHQLHLIRGLPKFKNWNLLFACIVKSAMSHLFFFIVEYYYIWNFSSYFRV